MKIIHHQKSVSYFSLIRHSFCQKLNKVSTIDWNWFISFVQTAAGKFEKSLLSHLFLGKSIHRISFFESFVVKRDDFENLHKDRGALEANTHLY